MFSSSDISAGRVVLVVVGSLGVVGALERLIRIRRFSGSSSIVLTSPTTDPMSPLYGCSSPNVEELKSFFHVFRGRVDRNSASLSPSTRDGRQRACLKQFEKLEVKLPAFGLLPILDCYISGEAAYKVPRQAVVDHLRGIGQSDDGELPSMKATLAGVVLFQLLDDLVRATHQPIPLREQDAANEVFDSGLPRELLAHLEDYNEYTAFFRSWINALSKEVLSRKRVNMQHLFRYMWASSPFKIACVGVSMLFVYGSSTLMLAGHHLRRRIDTLVFSEGETRGFSPLSSEHLMLSSLVGIEILRMACNTILDNASREFLMASTAHHRERTKMDLYVSLMRAPLSFYDEYSYDDVEEMVMFVNDLEGVDVHVQNFLMNALKVGLDCSAKLTTINAEANVTGMLLLGILIVSVSSPIEWALTKVISAQQRQNQVEDLEELENISSSEATKDLCSNVLLRGLEIVEHVHTLRPLGGDVRLMQWWVEFVENLTDFRDFGGVIPERRERKPHRVSRLRLAWDELSRAFDVLARRISLRVIRVSVVWVGPLASSTKKMFKTMLPLLIVSILHASQRGGKDIPPILLSPTFIHEVIVSVETLIDSVKGGRDLWELMQLNAHKAHIIHCVRCQWHRQDDSNSLKKGVDERLLQPTNLIAKNLSFAYPSRPDRLVIQNLNLSIPLTPGKIIALTGPNGCGKSTLLSLLMRLYEPTAPSIASAGLTPQLVLDVVDYRAQAGIGVMEKISEAVAMTLQRSFHGYPDHEEEATAHDKDVQRESCKKFDLCKFGTSTAQSIFTFAPQTPVIFPGTVAQNISLDAQITMGDSERLDRIRQVARHAQCDEFIQGLPEGYFTQVASMGGSGGSALKLSGGQAQRICIARALFRSSQILILDEPTSSLDAVARIQVLEGLRSLISKNDIGDSLREVGHKPNEGTTVRTVICVTHDEEVLRAADVIVHMPRTCL